MKEPRVAERVEDLVGRAEATVDTIPAQIFEGVVRYYGRHGYRLRRYVLLAGSRPQSTFETHEGSR